MDKILKGAVFLIAARDPKKHTRLRVLEWLVKRHQIYRKAASR